MAALMHYTVRMAIYHLTYLMLVYMYKQGFPQTPNTLLSVIIASTNPHVSAFPISRQLVDSVSFGFVTQLKQV